MREDDFAVLSVKTDVMDVQIIDDAAVLTHSIQTRQRTGAAPGAEHGAIDSIPWLDRRDFTMPQLYGNSITEAEQIALLARLGRRGTIEAVFAATTVKGAVAHRDATQETAVEARDAILNELQAWPDLENAHPGLAAVRDRLASL